MGRSPDSISGPHFMPSGSDERDNPRWRFDNEFGFYSWENRNGLHIHQHIVRNDALALETICEEE